MENFPESKVQHLRMEESDHCMILISTNNTVRLNNRPFRFIQTWTTDDSSTQMVDKTWNLDSRGGMHCHRLDKSFKETAMALRKWNKKVFEFAQNMIKNLLRELDFLRSADQEHAKQLIIQ